MLQFIQNASPPTLGETVLKDSDVLDLLEVTYHGKMTFENLLHSVSRAAVQSLRIMKKSWYVFYDETIL